MGSTANPQAYFLWQGDNLLAELTGGATGKIAEYSYYPGLDNPHAVITGTTPYFAHVDALGNVIALTDSAATPTVKRSYDFDAWGVLTGGSDVKPFTNADRARFKGALWLGPEADVYYMRARWYEPKTGRFLSEDPKGISAGLNLYSFAFDDPVNGRDPTGLDGFDPCPAGYEMLGERVITNDDGTETVLTFCGPDRHGPTTRYAYDAIRPGIPVGWSQQAKSPWEFHWPANLDGPFLKNGHCKQRVKFWEWGRVGRNLRGGGAEKYPRLTVILTVDVTATKEVQPSDQTIYYAGSITVKGVFGFPRFGGEGATGTVNCKTGEADFEIPRTN